MWRVGGGGGIRRPCEQTRAEQKQDPESGQKLLRGVRAGRGNMGGLEGGGDRLALGSFAAVPLLSGGGGGRQRRRAAENVSQLNVKRPGNRQPSRDGNRRRADV